MPFCSHVTLATNEFKQAIYYCEHSMVHVMHQHTTVTTTLTAFLQLNQEFESRFLHSYMGLWIWS